MAVKRGNNLRNTLTGTNGNDSLLGLGGNDTLTGKSGNDLLDGGKGADRMTGGLGDDTYIVDSKGDRVIEKVGQGTDTVRSSISLTLGINVEHLVLTGTKAISGALNSDANEIGNSLTGNNAANLLLGGLGHDVLAGGLGGDTLLGGDGNDTLIPGAGNGVADVIYGGAGFDTLDYRDAQGRVYIDINNFGNVIGDAAAGDVISNVEAVVGSAFDDILTTEPETAGGFQSYAYGGGGNDIIYATANVFDRIRGDDGFDVLNGDPGSADDFWLQYDRGVDFVNNFNGVQDHVFIDHAEFGLSTTPGTFINATDFEANVYAGVPVFAAGERLIFDTNTNTLWADKDGPGGVFRPVPVAMFEQGFEPGLTNIFVF